MAMPELFALLHAFTWYMHMSRKLVPLATIVDACRAANLPEEVHGAIALDPAATSSPAALARAVNDAAEILALTRMAGHVVDEYGTTDKQASERAGIDMIRRRVPLDEARTRICHALADQDAATHIDTSRRVDDGVAFSPWQARAGEGAR